MTKILKITKDDMKQGFDDSNELSIQIPSDITDLEIGPLIEDIYLKNLPKNIKRLDLANAANLTWINCKDSSVESIENIPGSIESIYANGCKNLSNIDLSNKENLQHVDISQSNVHEVDLSNTVNLKEFICEGSEIGSVTNISKSIQVLKVGFSKNIENIDLSDLEKLREFSCQYSGIRSITINGFTSLREANISGCKNFEDLDLKNAEQLTELNCKDSGVRSITNLPQSLRNLNVSGCYNLKTLDLRQQISALYAQQLEDNLEKMKQNPRLKKIAEKMDLKAKLEKEGLQDLNCSNSSIESITNIPRSLCSLNLNNSKIQSLDLLRAKNLRQLLCENTPIRSIINIPKSLNELVVDESENLLNLDLSGAERLEKLSCRYCVLMTSIRNIPDSLKEIDLTGCRNLVKNEELERSLEKLKEKGCMVYLPDHWGKQKPENSPEPKNSHELNPQQNKHEL